MRLPGGARLDGVLAALTRADAHRFVDLHDEDLSVADAAGLGAALDGVDDAGDHAVGDDDLDLHLGDEIDDVRRAAVDLFLAAGAAEAFHFGDGHALDAHLG